MSERRPQPGLPMFLVSIVACVALVVVASVYSSRMQFGAVHASFHAIERDVAGQIKADAAAHAQLAKVETSDFGESAGALVTALTPCLGPAALGPTESGLQQVTGFAKLKGARRDVPPKVVASEDDADELADVQQLSQALHNDKARTGETLAVVQANLVAQDEVNQDLAAVASNIAAAPRALVSKDDYASAAAKSAFAKSVAGLATVVAKIAPELKSDGPIKVSAAQSASLLAALASFATSCEAEAASSAAHTPRAVTIAYLGWGMKAWPVVTFPYSMTLTVKTAGDPTRGCTSTKLIAEGIATGHLGQKVTVTVPGADPPVFKVLTHFTSATSVQWAVVACSSA